MRAAVLHEYGTPRPGEFADPVAGDGEVVVEVAAAALNPVDVRRADGTYFGDQRPLPFVAGTEGDGRVAGEDRRVYFDTSVPPYGSMAERALVPAGQLVDVPDGLDDALAVAVGIAGLAAWLPLAWRAQLQPGERVLILGATGVVGSIAVQAAKLLGAGRVVAAGRDPDRLRRTRQLGADETVELTADATAAELAEAFRSAAGGDLDVVLDPLWGVPGVAAIEALGIGGRQIQIGQSAGAEATLASGPVRSRLLEIRGYIQFATPREVLANGYREIAGHAAAGRITLDFERVALDDVEPAWEQLRAGAQRKLVLIP